MWLKVATLTCRGKESYARVRPKYTKEYDHGALPLFHPFPMFIEIRTVDQDSLAAISSSLFLLLSKPDICKDMENYYER